MQRRQRRCHPPVELLGERRVAVPGAQAGFHVRDRDLVVVRGEGAGEAARGVALDDDDIRSVFAQHPVEPFQGTRRDVGKRLARTADRQVVVCHQVESVEDRLDHVPVLACVDHGHREARVGHQTAHDRSQLDRFGPGAEHHQRSADRGFAVRVHAYRVAREGAQGADPAPDGAGSLVGKEIRQGGESR